jgi:uncharacterized membrane protein
MSETAESGTSARESGERLSPTTRVETFSDGVMAIAITLLILEVHVPVRTHGNLLHELLHEWASYLAYVDSFLTIGVIWLCHHTFFNRVRRIDGFLQWGNLTLLLVVAFIPFPTAVLARNLAGGGWDARVATALYGMVAMVQAAAWLIMWAALRRRPDLLEPGFDAKFLRIESRLAWGGIAVFAGCAGLGLVAPIASLVLYVVATLGYGITSSGWHTFLGRAPQGRSA